MKIQILQENLAKILTRTGKIVSAKTQMPVLQNVLIATENSFVKMATTNMETTMNCMVGAKVEKEGGACVSSRLLTELVLSLPQETVTLEEKEGSLIVSTSRTTATIPGVSPSEFPPVVVPEKKTGVTIESNALLSALSSVLYSAATDDGRPLLTGIKIISVSHELTFVATDGYRLSIVKMPHQNNAEFDVVIPARALGELNRILTEEKTAQNVVMEQTGDGQVIFRVGETVIITRLIDGEYPPYQKIIPKTFATKVKTDKNVFLHAVKSAAIFARDNANIIKLQIDKNGISVSANTPQVGQNTVTVDGEMDGDGGDIAFNSRFLLDFLNNYKDDEVLFEMTGSLNPGAFKSPKDASYLHIIMPVRVQS